MSNAKIFLHINVFNSFFPILLFIGFSLVIVCLYLSSLLFHYKFLFYLFYFGVDLLSVNSLCSN